MKRQVIFLALIPIIFFVQGCVPGQPTPRLEPWNVADQDPNVTGIVFLKVKPTLARSIRTSQAPLEAETFWSLVGPSIIEGQKTWTLLGRIETIHLHDQKYILHPLKKGTYVLYYASLVTNTYMVTSRDIRNYYYIEFTIEPGKIKYLGSYQPVETTNLKSSSTKKTLSYIFTRMEKHDDYERDISWLSDHPWKILDKFEPINYYGELIDTKTDINTHIKNLWPRQNSGRLDKSLL